MSEMPWVRFFPSDWLGGTRGMSAAETGIYITLVATMYERGEPIPEDHPRLARLCGASNSTFKTALETLVVEGKILRSEEGLWNERVQKESVYRSEKSEVGKQAANARWYPKGNKNNGDAHANVMPTHSDGNANQKPDTRKIEGANAPYSSEPEKSAPSAVATLPTVSEGEVPFFPTDLDEWAKAFPAVNVRQQLAAMRSWLIANPTKRKTKRGMRKFVVSWLDRKQNAGSAPAQNGHSPPNGKRQNAVEAMEEIFRDKGWMQEDEQEFIPSRNGDAQCLPSERRSEQGAIVDLRPGADWRSRSGH